MLREIKKSSLLLEGVFVREHVNLGEHIEVREG